MSELRNPEAGLRKIAKDLAERNITSLEGAIEAIRWRLEYLEKRKPENENQRVALVNRIDEIRNLIRLLKGIRRIEQERAEDESNQR